MSILNFNFFEKAIAFCRISTWGCPNDNPVNDRETSLTEIVANLDK